MRRSKLEMFIPLEEISLPEEMTIIRVKPDEIEVMIQKLREDHLTIQPVAGPVKEGDFVLLDLPTAKDFRLLNTARPMGEKSLAVSCLGCIVGEDVAEGYRIAGIKRRILPEFSEELILAANIPEVLTLEAYRAYCMQTIRKRKTKRNIRTLSGWLTEEWIRRCQFSLDEDELEMILAELEDSIQAHMEKNSWSREQTVEMLARILGGNSLRECATALMRCVLLGERCLEKYGIALTQEQYERSLAKIAKEHGGQPADYSTTYPYSMFLQQRAMVQIDTEVKKNIKERAPFRYE